MIDPGPVTSLRGARLGYPRHVVFDRVDLDVARGDFLAIVGPNGSGKTTILRTVLGVLPPLAGTAELRARAGYCPQRRALDAIWPLAAREVVGMGLLGGTSRGLARAEERRRVDGALEACGMRELADRPFRELSGGQGQRVLIARALVADPEVLVLDEPTNDLDLAGEHSVMGLVTSLHRAGKTVIVVSHLLSVVANYATRVALIASGRLEPPGPTGEVLTGERLRALYGVPVAVGIVDGRRAIVGGGAAQA